MPLAIDLYAGLGGWAEGLLAEGWEVVGFDIERHQYGEHHYPASLVLQDVRTLHGSQFRDADLIVASPPCQEYSYMAMPWSRAKAIAAEYRSGKRDVAKLNELFDACFRIQREACAAAGRHIPMVVENVRGAIPWVGRSRWNFGSYHLWGDVPALMPIIVGMPKFKGGDRNTGRANGGTDHVWGGTWKVPGFRFDGNGGWFGDDNPSMMRLHSSKSPARKAASAMIAKIPEPLARHIARVFLPGKGRLTERAEAAE